ncbi:MAG: hypothetical protein K2X32_14600 [Phycisphaerales bacterium]|nr:hypothetical protein [Phycisphaerales bacterium]
MNTKRTMMWWAWGLVPLAALVVHAGPGQALWTRDRAASVLSEARAAEAKEEWEIAAAKYAQARQAVSADEPRLIAELTLAEGRARAWSGDLLAAGEQLETLLAQQVSDPKADPGLLKRARAELASTAYATAWALRVEGATSQEWMPESERARQQYRLLAEGAVASEDVDAQLLKENLEAVIRFQDIPGSDLSEMDEPGQCKNSKPGLRQGKRSQSMSKSKTPAPKDARDKINQGSGENPFDPKGS